MRAEAWGIAIVAALGASCATHRVTSSVGVVDRALVTESLGQIAPVQVLQEREAAEEGWAFRGIPRAIRSRVYKTLNEPDPAVRALVLSSAWTAVESEPLIREAVRSRLIDALAATGEIDRIEGLLRATPVASSRDGAEVYREAAEAFIRSGVKLDEARQLLVQGFAIIAGYDSIEAPQSVPTYAWKRGFENARIRLLMAVAQLEAKTGHLDRTKRIFASIFERQDAAWGRKAFAEALEQPEPVRAKEEYTEALARTDKEDDFLLAAIARLDASTDRKTLLEQSAARRPANGRKYARQLRFDEVVPSFEAIWEDGARLGADSLAGDKVVVLSFFESTCGPCIGEQKFLAELRPRYGSSLRIVVVSLDGPATTKAYLEKSRIDGFEYSRVLDEKAVRAAFQFNGVPMSLVVRDGKIAHRHDGYGPWTKEFLPVEIDALLEDAKPGR